MTIKIASVDSLILYFGEIISSEILDDVQQAYHQLKTLEHIIDLTPSYNSILVQYDLLKEDYQSIQKKIDEKLEQPNLDQHMSNHKVIEIPVDYTQNLDLERVATLNQLSIEEVIQRHTKQSYRVYAIGFIVGFAYLAKVDKTIRTPRLDTPRAKVPKGSVAIADLQTAIYPEASAGGWNIIGHTNFNDFKSFEIGDSVRFIDARL